MTAVDQRVPGAAWRGEWGERTAERTVGEHEEAFRRRDECVHDFEFSDGFTVGTYILVRENHQTLYYKYVQLITCYHTSL